MENVDGGETAAPAGPCPAMEPPSPCPLPPSLPPRPPSPAPVLMRPGRRLKGARRLLPIVQLRGGDGSPRQCSSVGKLCCLVLFASALLCSQLPRGTGASRRHVVRPTSPRWVPWGADRGRRGGRRTSPRPAVCLFTGAFLLSSPVRGSDGSGELAALPPPPHGGFPPRVVSASASPAHPVAAGSRRDALGVPDGCPPPGTPREMPRRGRPFPGSCSCCGAAAAGERSAGPAGHRHVSLLGRCPRGRLQRGTEGVREHLKRG